MHMIPVEYTLYIRLDPTNTEFVIKIWTGDAPTLTVSGRKDASVHSCCADVVSLCARCSQCVYYCCLGASGTYDAFQDSRADFYTSKGRVALMVITKDGTVMEDVPGEAVT